MEVLSYYLLRVPSPPRRKPYRKPLSRLYFAVPLANSSEQFFYFTSLVRSAGT